MTRSAQTTTSSELVGKKTNKPLGGALVPALRIVHMPAVRGLSRDVGGLLIKFGAVGHPQASKSRKTC